MHSHGRARETARFHRPADALYPRHAPDNHQSPTSRHQPRNFATTAFVTGLIALLTTITTFGGDGFGNFEVMFLLGGLLGIAAIVFAVLAIWANRRQRNARTGLAIAGLCLGILAIAIRVLLIIAIAVAFRDLS